MIGCRRFLDVGKNPIVALGQTIEIVHQVDQQKFPGEFPWESRLEAKFELAAAKRKIAMTLVIIDDGLVVKLARADAQAVVGAGRSEKKTVIPEKGGDQFFVLRGRFAENRVRREQVQSARKLGKRAIRDQLLEVSVDSIRPGRQIFATINSAPPQMLFEFLELGHAPNMGRTDRNCKYFT